MLGSVLFVLSYIVFLAESNYLSPGEIRRIRFRIDDGHYSVFIKKDAETKIEINATVGNGSLVSSTSSPS